MTSCQVNGNALEQVFDIKNTITTTFKVKSFTERSRSGQLASTPFSERSLLMLYH